MLKYHDESAEGAALFSKSEFVTELRALSRLCSTSVTESLEGSLAVFAREFGYRQMGLLWPVEGEAKVGIRTSASGDCRNERITLTPEIITACENGGSACLGDPGRPNIRFVPLQWHRQAPGLLWAEREEVWSEAEECLFELLAGIWAKSEGLKKLLGLRIDADRLCQRLHDGGILAGRIAHDYDNLWTGILGFTDLTLPLLKAGSNEHQFIAEVATIGNRGTVLTNQLHQFSRSGTPKPLPASLASIVSKEQLRLKAAFNGRMRWTLDIPADLPSVGIEAGTLQVAVGHLLDNALEAMPNGGPIRVEARRVDLSRTSASRYLGNVSSGKYVALRITDGGVGIREEVFKKLFHEPFFTTKPRHRGLGLAIVYRILHVHGGGLMLDSEVGKGTTVEAVFPEIATTPLTPPMDTRGNQ